MRNSRFKILFLLGIFLPLISFSQKRKIDSLEKVLAKTSVDTDKVNLMASLSFGYRSIDPAKGKEYGAKARDLAEKINYERGNVNAMNSLATNEIATGEYDEAEVLLKKAIEIEKRSGIQKEMEFSLN